MKRQKKSRKNRLPDHEDAIVAINSPHGLIGDKLYTASKNGEVISIRI